jgi:large subunit ribosomal protein L6
MKLGAKEEFEAPEGVELKLTGKTVEVSGPKGRLTKTFDIPNVSLKVEGRKISIESKSMRRKEKAAVSAIKAHVQNMCRGVTEGFTYKLRVVYSHFPITVKVDGKHVLIHNFLGERSPRVAKIVGDTKVEVRGEEIIVSGASKEDVGQTALNIEQATAVKYRDLRTFQDGCYITERM